MSDNIHDPSKAYVSPWVKQSVDDWYAAVRKEHPNGLLCQRCLDGLARMIEGMIDDLY